MNNNGGLCVQDASLAESSPYTWWNIVYESLGGMRGETESMKRRNEGSSGEKGKPRGRSDPRRATRERKEEGGKDKKCSPRHRNSKQNDKQTRMRTDTGLLLRSVFPSYDDARFCDLAKLRDGRHNTEGIYKAKTHARRYLEDVKVRISKRAKDSWSYEPFTTS